MVITYRDNLNRLQSRAALQIAKRGTDANYTETLPVAPGKGFARLPHPNAGDIFFGRRELLTPLAVLQGCGRSKS